MKKICWNIGFKDRFSCEPGLFFMIINIEKRTTNGFSFWIGNGIHFVIAHNVKEGQEYTIGFHYYTKEILPFSDGFYLKFFGLRAQPTGVRTYP